MPQEQMQELYKELKNAQSTSEYYAPFLEAMKTLDTEMKSLMEPDENGWKLLDPERFRSFSEKYRDAGIKLEQYLGRTANTADPAERETREKANKLAALMAQDAAVFRHYDPRNPDTQRSLPSLLEESRNPVVDISTAKIQSVGGAQSSRMPMTIIGPNGEALPGVFTKAEIFDPLGSFDRATNLAANSKGVTQQGADLLRNFSTAYKNYYTANPDPNRPVDNNPNMINQLLLQSRGNTDSSTSWTMSTDKIAQEIAKVNGLSVEEVKTACGKKALGDLAGRMKNMAFDTYIKASEIQMEDKTRVDRKNTGMSIVADVLGISHVICHSEAMKIKTADGKIIDGTFMAMAKGVDPNNPGAEARNAGKKSLKNTDGRALEAIADLQVLDYICGNVDRHGGNLFYQFDEETGKLIGVQGIDNDSSLGTRVPQLKNERVRRLPVCHTMGVISKKTADKIMNLTPAELAFALRGTVDEKSIQACANRLRVVQGNIEHSREKLDPNSKEIKYPYLQELTTEEFATADLSKLTDKRVDNHFKEIYDTLPRVGARARVAVESLKAKTVGSENRATISGVTGQVLKAGQMKKMLSDKTSFWRGSSSQNYKDIEEAVKEYEAYQKKLLTRMQNGQKSFEKGETTPEAVFGRHVTSFDMNQMNAGLKKIKNAADKYATEKLAELAAKGKTPEDDPYIKKRIELAQEISAYAGERLEPSKEERETVAASERRAAEEIVRKEVKKQAQAPKEQKAPEDLQAGQGEGLQGPKA